MSFFITPNMNLPVPAVGNEPGPEYAFDINNCMTLVDAHNHTPGYGVQIPPGGLNINSALTFQGNPATNVGYVNLTPQSVQPPINSLYESGVDLYFVDGNNNNVRLTESGFPAGPPGNITNLVPPASAVYDSGTKTFVWESNVNIAANMDFGSATFRNLSPNSTFGVTLRAPAALGSNYSITLPTPQSNTRLLTLSSAGVMGTQGSGTLGALLTGTSSGTAWVVMVPGSNGQVLSADSTAPTGLRYVNATNSLISTKTSNYTVLSTDSTILVDGSSGAFTITLPAASSVSNQKFIIKRTDNTIANPVTISGTIDGATDWALYTQNESLEIQSNGTNYYSIRHDTNTDWIDDGFIIIRATGTTPTKGVASTDKVIWRRVGNFAEVNYTYVQLANGADGSGDYLFTLPNGLTVDTTYITPYTGSVGTSLITVYAAYTAAVNSSGSAVPDSGNFNMSLTAYMYNTTQFRLNGWFPANPGTVNVAATTLPLGGNNVAFSVNILIPIDGWKA